MCVLVSAMHSCGRVIFVRPFAIKAVVSGPPGLFACLHVTVPQWGLDVYDANTSGATIHMAASFPPMEVMQMAAASLNRLEKRANRQRARSFHDGGAASSLGALVTTRLGGGEKIPRGGGRC
jgi:hypothetical protein